MQKIAVAVVHGIGKENPDFTNKSKPQKFAAGMAKTLKTEVAKLLQGEAANPENVLEFEAIYWAPALQELQNKLWQRLGIQKLSFFNTRDFIFHALADSIAYQITSEASPSDRYLYDRVHSHLAEGLNRLAANAGATAPLCAIAHSLGSTITTNYLWDLQHGRASATLGIGDTPLEKGETLTLLYTLGTQLPLWKLSYEDFGVPIAVPAPQLDRHYPNLKGEWINFYDKEDVLGYPIKEINKEYEQAVTGDRQVNVGRFWESWNPLSHNGYWKDREVVMPIAESLARVWRTVNQV